MDLPPNDRLTEVMRQVEALQTELTELRHCQMKPTHRYPGRVRHGLFAVPLIVAASWAWSAQASSPLPAEIEQRLSALESLVRKGPANTTQVTAPLDVIGPNGKIILRVGSGPPTAGAVAIWTEPGRPGGNVTTRSDNGHDLAALATSKEGYGVLDIMDKKGVIRTALTGMGAIGIFDEKRNQAAGMTVSEEGRGRMSVWNKDARVAIMTTSNEGYGYISVTDPKGEIARAGMVGKGGINVTNEDGDQVAALIATAEGRGRVAVWSKNEKAAMMEVNDQEAGTVTVMNKGGKIVGKIGADQGNAGKITVMNSAGNLVASMMGGQAGGGIVAVANSSSMPLAQMSVSDDGRGLVQVFKKTGVSPIAVLTEAVERPGGLLQISNANGPVASVTVGQGGGGYWQLTNAAGLPTVEAGTMENGWGSVRAGPTYKCHPAQLSSPIPLVAIGLPDCIVGGPAGKKK